MSYSCQCGAVTTPFDSCPACEKKVATLQSKEQAWSGLGTHPVSPRIFWITSSGQKLHPTEMRTFHLFAALQIVWNNETGWAKHIEYDLAKRVGRLHEKAVHNLLNELLNRPDRTDFMEVKLREISDSIGKKKSKKR